MIYHSVKLIFASISNTFCRGGRLSARAEVMTSLMAKKTLIANSNGGSPTAYC